MGASRASPATFRRPAQRFGPGPLALRSVVTLEDAEAQARELADLVTRTGVDFDLVIGIANGGVHPALHVARTLGLPLSICRVQRRTSKLKQKLGFARRLLSPKFLRRPVYVLNRLVDRALGGVSGDATRLDVEIRGRKVLIVDDCIDSGASVAHIRRMLQKQGAAQIQVAVLCWTTKYDSVALHGVAPDYFLGRTLPSYPWSADSAEYAKFQRWLEERRSGGKRDGEGLTVPLR